MQNALTMTDAARRLGITRTTLRRLVKEGRLPTMENPLDKRERLIPESALERLQAQGSRPRPRSAGALFDPEMRSDELEDYIAAHWQME